METKTANRKIQWLPILLIIWNILHIVVHIAVDMVEPLRISGNIVGLVAAVIVLLGLFKPYQPALLGLATAAVIFPNTIESALHGYLVPILIFVGVSVIILILMTQNAIAKANAESDGETRSLMTTLPTWMRSWSGHGLMAAAHPVNSRTNESTADCRRYESMVCEPHS